MDWITILITGSCVAMAAAASWACFSPRVHDRLLMKLGLVLLALGSAFQAWLLHDGVDLLDVVATIRAQLLVNGGMVVVVMAWALRGRPSRSHVPERRASDFVDLDDRPHHREEAAS